MSKLLRISFQPPILRPSNNLCISTKGALFHPYNRSVCPKQPLPTSNFTWEPLALAMIMTSSNMQISYNQVSKWKPLETVVSPLSILRPISYRLLLSSGQLNTTNWCLLTYNLAGRDSSMISATQYSKTQSKMMAHLCTLRKFTTSPIQCGKLAILFIAEAPPISRAYSRNLRT